MSFDATACIEIALCCIICRPSETSEPSCCCCCCCDEEDDKKEALLPPHSKYKQPTFPEPVYTVQ